MSDKKDTHLLNKLIMIHFWINPNDDALLWKFYANTELFVYISSSEYLDDTTEIY